MGLRSNPGSFLGKVGGETAATSSKRKKKIGLGQDLLYKQKRAHSPKPLTRRELMSQVSGLYDPVGLMTPAKQKGAILVRRAFQEAKAGNWPLKDTWDTALSDNLREDAVKLFEEYIQLGKVHQSTDTPVFFFFDNLKMIHTDHLHIRSLMTQLYYKKILVELLHL